MLFKYVFVILNTLSGVVIFLDVWIIPKIKECLKKKNQENSTTGKTYVSSGELFDQHTKSQ